MTPQEHDRMLELACDRALVGLTPDGQAELEAFLGVGFDGRALDVEVAAAAIQLAEIGQLEALPRGSAERAWQAAGAFFAAHGATAMMPELEPAAPRAGRALARGAALPGIGSVPPPPGSAPPPGLVSLAPAPPPTMVMPPQGTAPTALDPRVQAPVAAPANVVPLRPKRDLLRWAGWLAAAACFALALAGWLSRGDVVAVGPAPSATASASSPTGARAALLASGAKDLVKADWTEATDPTGRGVKGDVVWSPSEQRGYMRFSGLAANDRAQAAYQLWIFDDAQDERFPVDGGVFDVDAATGDVIVPITAKLRVKHPTLFAVTVEKPGGVVVSKRDRLVVTAKVTG